MIENWWLSKVDGTLKTYLFLNPYPFFYFQGDGSETPVLPVFGGTSNYRIKYQNLGLSLNNYQIELNSPYVDLVVKNNLDLLFLEDPIFLGKDTSIWKVIWLNDQSYQINYIEGTNYYTANLKFRLESIVV